MKKLVFLTVLLATTATFASADNAFESVAAGSGFVVPSPDAAQGRSFQPDQLSLYVSGPWVTHFGTGVQGADESWVQTNLLMSIYGFGNQVLDGNRLADSFTVPAGQTWNIEGINFFGYQTGSSTTSTIMSVNVRIWQGTPGAGGTVVWGNTSTNRLSSSWWTNTYRVLDTETGMVSDRPVMQIATSFFVSLGPGTYWVDWQVDGDPAFSGPWANPITRLGQTTSGNALQSLDGGASTV